MKSCNQFEAIPSSKREIVEMFLYATVSFVLLSRALLRTDHRWWVMLPYPDRMPCSSCSRPRMLIAPSHRLANDPVA